MSRRYRYRYPHPLLILWLGPFAWAFRACRALARRRPNKIDAAMFRLGDRLVGRFGERRVLIVALAQPLLFFNLALLLGMGGGFILLSLISGGLNSALAWSLIQHARQRVLHTATRSERPARYKPTGWTVMHAPLPSAVDQHRYSLTPNGATLTAALRAEGVKFSRIVAPAIVGQQVNRSCAELLHEAIVTHTDDIPFDQIFQPAEETTCAPS